MGQYRDLREAEPRVAPEDTSQFISTHEFVFTAISAKRSHGVWGWPQKAISRGLKYRRFVSPGHEPHRRGRGLRVGGRPANQCQ
jgi:hypothetical protein